MDTPLRKIRRARRLTLTDVARSNGMDAGNLSRIERGAQAASPEVAEKLSKYFDGEVTELEIIYPERYSGRTRTGQTAR